MGVKVAVIGKGEETKPVLGVPDDNDPRILMNGQSTLYISKIELRDDGNKSAKNYFNCMDDSYLHLDQVRVANLENPMLAAGCEITLNRTVITNTSGGSTISESKLTMVNSFVSSNTNAANFGGPFRLSTNTEVNLTNVTFVDNQGTTTTGIICAAGIVTMNIRNSVLLGDPAPLKMCQVDDSPGTFTQTDKDLWKTLFQSPKEGIFRPKSGADDIKIATWAEGDPYIDYDGNLRSTDLEELVFAGATRP
ncbi:MAG TPA: hypothetical protein ENJ18_08410 [Nannocystis exedens]|nr:hypothetical protein [Nannocystis exedens]